MLIALRIFLVFLPLISYTATFFWTQILPSISSDSSRPEVVLFPDGNGVAIWTESGGTVLKSSSFVQTTQTWETSVTLGTSADPITAYDLSVSPDGFAMAVWAQPSIPDPTSPSAWASLYKLSDHSWTSFGELNSFLTQASDLSNAFIGNDLSVITWRAGFDPLIFSPSAYCYIDVNTAMVLENSFLSTLFNQHFPTAQGKTGSSDAIVLYLRSDFNDPSTNQVEAAVIHYPFANPSNFTAISGTGLDELAPTFSMNLQGQGICGWIDGGQIYVSHLTDFTNNTWAAPQLIVGPSGITTAPISTVDSSGTGAIAWVSNVMGVSVVQLSFFDSGSATWSSPIDVSNSSSSATSPSITVTEAGRFGLVWVQDGILQSRIYENGVWIPALATTATPIPGGTGGTLPDVFFADGSVVKGVCVWEGMSIDSAYLGSLVSPLALTGQQVLYRYPVQGDLVNQLSWSATTGAASYKVFRGDLNTLIAQTSNLSYDDHQRVPYQTVTYYVSSIDANGDDSGDLNSITIPAITNLK